jgi:hypothetical protein
VGLTGLQRSWTAFLDELSSWGSAP